MGIVRMVLTLFYTETSRSLVMQGSRTAVWSVGTSCLSGGKVGCPWQEELPMRGSASVFILTISALKCLQLDQSVFSNALKDTLAGHSKNGAKMRTLGSRLFKKKIKCHLLKTTERGG